MRGFRVRNVGMVGFIAALALAAAAFVSAAPASAALSYVASENTITTGDDQGASTVRCPDSSFIVGGGAFSSGGFNAVAIINSSPAGNIDWGERTDVYTGPQGHRAFAICDTTEPALEATQKTVVGGTEKTARAKCGPGEHIYGGGYFSNITFGATVTSLSRPYRNKSGDGWKATVFSNFGDRDLTVYALCGPLKTSLRTKTVNVAKKTQGFAQKRCGSGDQVTGGGAGIEVGNGKGWISSIYPADAGDGDNETDDIWGAYLENDSSKKREITAYAVCR